MSPYEKTNNYLHNHYEGMDPKQLILLLYKGALHRLKLTMEGIEENDIKKRGENLSKVIGIVAELNASVDTTMKDESTLFLRGLYNAMLMELPKVSINSDIKILKRTEAYISRLKEIWENDVITKETSTQTSSLKSNFENNYNKTDKANFSSIAV